MDELDPPARAGRGPTERRARWRFSRRPRGRGRRCRGARAVVAEKDAAGLREDVAALRPDVGECVRSSRVTNSSSCSSRRMSGINQAGARHAHLRAENELGEARTQRRDAVERSKQLELDMEAADKERRAALRAQKKAETQMLELQREVAKLVGEPFQRWRRSWRRPRRRWRRSSCASRALRGDRGGGKRGQAAHRRAGEGDGAQGTRRGEDTPLRSASSRRRRRRSTPSRRAAAASLERRPRTAAPGWTPWTRSSRRWRRRSPPSARRRRALLGSTEKALDKWTGDIARVSQQAMDKARAAVAMLVSTIKTLKESRRRSSRERRRSWTSPRRIWGKTGAELRATTQELL